MMIKKVIIAPDSFKGTMSSPEICEIIREQFIKLLPETEVVSLPIADGGEGSAECFLIAKPGKRVPVKVKGPYFEEMNAVYALINGGQTAIVELAVSAGLPLVGDRKNPALTTTYGVGQMILHAAESGAEEILIAIGGSCTNDGGCGLATALGVRFINKEGKSFIPTGETLIDIDKIDVAGISQAIKNVRFRAMCDVDNPVYGKNGAAYVFGPQKGAGVDMVIRLDKGLKHLAEKIKTSIGKDISGMPGAGAAGGTSGGLAAFFDCSLESGIQMILDETGFEELVRGCDLILTGEGKIDSQSLRGKVIDGVASRAMPLGIPVIAVVGDIGDGYEEIYNRGVSAVVSTNRVAVPFEIARKRAKSDLKDTLDDLIRILKI
jgi:glycerate kinase